MSAATDVKPVDFYNPIYPNEEIRIREAGEDPAAAKVIRFVGGHFRAKEQWEIDAIEAHAKHRAFRGDLSNVLVCPTCGWPTKSVEALNKHLELH